jgi:ABC-type Fe3+-hydroxamate transport system substrate-binding protein
MGGKGGAGGGKGGGQIQQGYDPYAMYDPELKSKAQAFADAARAEEFNEYFQEQIRLEAERLAGKSPSEAYAMYNPTLKSGDVSLRPR